MTTHTFKQDSKSIRYHYTVALSNGDQLHYTSSSILLDICLARVQCCNFAALRNIYWLNALRDFDRFWLVC